MNKSKRWPLIGLLILAGSGIVYPLFWIVLSAFRSGNALYSADFHLSELTMDHFYRLFTATEFPLWFLNTLELAGLHMVAGLILTALTAFSFSRLTFKGKGLTQSLVLILQIFPTFLSMLALFILLDRWNLLNSYFGLILVYLAGQLPFNTWMVKGYMDALPRSLDEAARIDGASDYQVFTRVILPLSTPVLGVVALADFTLPWFDFVFQSLLLHGDRKTLAVGVLEWLHSPSGQQFPLFAAACLLIALPVMLMFLIIQKFLNPVMMVERFKT